MLFLFCSDFTQDLTSSSFLDKWFIIQFKVSLPLFSSDQVGELSLRTSFRYLDISMQEIERKI